MAAGQNAYRSSSTIPNSKQTSDRPGPLTINEEIEREGIDPDSVELVIDPTPRGNRHRGRFNVPGADEISVLLEEDDGSGIDRHAIRTPMRQSDPDTNPIRQIPDHHRSHDPLLYPIFTPNGEDGWYRGLLSKGKKVSMKQYWRFRSMDRDTRLIDPNDEDETVQEGNPDRAACGQLLRTRDPTDTFTRSWKTRWQLQGLVVSRLGSSRLR